MYVYLSMSKRYLLGILGGGDDEEREGGRGEGGRRTDATDGRERRKVCTYNVITTTELTQRDLCAVLC
jgi:hypothetical protein